jgi:hypothetical protein
MTMSGSAEGKDDDMTPEPVRNSSRRSLLRWTVVPVAIIGAVAVGVSGWAAASGDSPSPSPKVSASPHAGPWGSRGGWGGDWGGDWGSRSRTAGFHGLLHGEAIFAKGGGGTRTMTFQQGTATAVSGSSVEVRSSDGFTQRYAADSALMVNGAKKGVSAVPRGKEIVIVALKGTGGPTAQRVFEVSSH